MLRPLLDAGALVFLTCACGSGAARELGASAPPSTRPGERAQLSMLDATAEPVEPNAPAAPAERPQPALSPLVPDVGSDIPPAPVEMLDIEAHIDVRVDDVRRAAADLRALVAQRGGAVTEEKIIAGHSEGRSPASAVGAEAKLTLRVPAGKSDAVVTAIHGLGEVTLQEMSARDVGKQYFDAALALSNLEVTLARYQKILDRATTVQDVLVIEGHLARVRGEIERVKGELRFLRDRVAKATLHVTLRHSTDAEPPSAAIHPGARATYLLDLRGSLGSHAYFGGGVSLRVVRALSFEIDALEAVDSNAGGVDGLLVTLGGDYYSQLAGGGERRFFNPYLGYRLGYARLPEGEDAFVVGGVLGLELLKTRLLSLDADVAGLGFFGDRRPHVGIQPALTANFAF